MLIPCVYVLQCVIGMAVLFEGILSEFCAVNRNVFCTELVVSNKTTFTARNSFSARNLFSAHVDIEW